MNFKILFVLFVALLAVALAMPGGGRRGGKRGGVQKKIVHHHWVNRPVPKIIYYNKVIPRTVPVPVYIPVRNGGDGDDGGYGTKVISGGLGNGLDGYDE